MSAALRKDMITMATKEKSGFVERCTPYILVTCEYHIGLRNKLPNSSWEQILFADTLGGKGRLLASFFFLCLAIEVCSKDYCFPFLL